MSMARLAQRVDPRVDHDDGDTVRDVLRNSLRTDRPAVGHRLRVTAVQRLLEVAPDRETAGPARDGQAPQSGHAPMLLAVRPPTPRTGPF